MPDSQSAWPLDRLQNVGHCVTETAQRMPQSIAVAAPKQKWLSRLQTYLHRPSEGPCLTEFETITFAQLESASSRAALGILESGLEPGTRIALMVPPGIDFVTWVFGLFKAGMVVILIDPGMGRDNMIRCLSEAKPQGMVGIPLAHAARQLFRSKLRQCRANFVLGRWPGCISIRRFSDLDLARFPQLYHYRENPAAIIFTTGSTGPPKGVLYRHRVFIEQARQIRDYFQIAPGTVDVSGFPLFALFNTAMGATTVFPKMDATRPADIHPPEFIHAVNSFQADQSFGSPALWNTVCKYCEKNSVRLPTIKRVLSAGAPVPANLLRRIKDRIATEGEAFTPYGATEALPVACISGTEVLDKTFDQSRRGAGTCVGRAFPDVQWRIIGITDEPIGTIAACQLLGQGEIGELIVRGPVVTDQYVTRPEANALHKIEDGDSFWHRMGDVGYLDEQDRFWFCGRKSHRVETTQGTMFTIPCEAIFNNHPKIYRSALVGVGPESVGDNLSEGKKLKGEYETPILVAEPLPEHWSDNREDQKTLIEELKELGVQNELTRPIQHILVRKSLPVDIRHNSKIFREQLRPWAREQIF